MSALLTPKGIISYPNLFKPRPRSKGGEPVYSMSLIFDDDATQTAKYKALVQAAEEAARERFPKLKMSQLTLPFRPCDEKEGYEELGAFFINPWTKNRPSVLDEDRENADEADVWPGMIARAYVRPFAWENSGNKGVSFGLEHVQVFIAESEGNERLDGRKNAREAFDDAEEDEEV